MFRFASRQGNVGRLALRAVFVLGALALAGAASAQCRVTEAGAGSNDGATWATAMTLQAALADASNCSEVWVQAGTYKPTNGADRSISFEILPGVEVYGGFAGTETQRSERDPGANLTTLSGDIGTSGDHSDNSYHVVWMAGTTSAGSITASTVLDGFTISGGNADGASAEIRGGGLYCNGRGSGHECSPSLGNLTFSGNRAQEDGGAMYNNGRNHGTSSPTLSNVIFSGNRAKYGGAMHNDGSDSGTSSPSLSNVTFSDNRADSRGGAIHNRGFGGGTSSPSLSNVTFSGNRAGESGGAMYNHGFGGASSPSLSNVTFSDNRADAYGGGAMYNRGRNDGRNDGTSSPTLSNVTFSGNSASSGGAMYNRVSGGGTSNPSLSNVIAWGNTAVNAGPQIYNSDATPTINHSVIQGSGGSASWVASLGTDGGGNLDADPLLGPLQNNGGLTQTLLPGAGSSALDAGNDTTCTTAPVSGLDQRGVTRPQGAQCDIGAVEVVTNLAVPTPVPTLDWRLLLLLAGLLGGFAVLRQRRA